MKTTFKTALVALLFAGVSASALAQDRDHADRSERGDRGDHGDRSDRAAGERPNGEGHGGGQRGGGVPQAAPSPAPAQAAAPQPRREDFRSPQDGHARVGAPPPSGQAPGAASSGGGQRLNDGPHEGPHEGPHDGGHHRDGGEKDQGEPGDTPTRAFDHARGPGVVTPPQARDEHGGDHRHDGHWDGHDDQDGRHRHWDGRNDRDGRWPNGHTAEYWQNGRYPPVYWSQDRYRLGAYRQPYGFYVRSWAFGDILPRGWYGRDDFLNDFLNFGLPYPPPGYEWVRVGGDALLIDEYSGRIVQVVRGIFY